MLRLLEFVIPGGFGITMSRTVTIRKARKDDAQAVWDVRDAAILAECAGHYPVGSLKVWTDGEITEEFIDAVPARFYVAVIHDAIVATGMVDLDSGHVDAIFVRPDYMRSGIGRKVLLHLEQLALDAGLTQLTLDSTLNAAPFYRLCGYVGEAIGRYESPRGIPLDCVPMKKALSQHE